MTTASIALQKALVTALKGDALLMARVGGVFETVPPGARPPYLVIGPDIATDWSTKTGEGREHRLRVTVWEAPMAVARCGEAMARVEAVLGSIMPTLDGHRIVTLRFLRSFIASVPGPGPVEGLIEFRARTQAL